MNRPWIVVHNAARDNYLAARVLADRQMLHALVTDLWTDNCLGGLLRRRLSRLERRYHHELSEARVFSFSARTVFDKIMHRITSQYGDAYSRWVFEGRRFGRRAASIISREAEKSVGVITYTCSALECLHAADRFGLHRVHCQIDPGFEYYKERQSEWERNPALEDPPSSPTSAFGERIREEWELAEAVVVNSKYSSQALIHYGVAAEKIHILPLALGRSPDPASVRLRGKSPKQALEVLWVGNVNLVKGFAYFAEAARILAGRGFNFTVAGSCYLRREYQLRIRNSMRFTGHLGRIALDEFYNRSDVLVFPTLSDGFGAVQVEALSRGIPVIATDHCGDVVEDGVSGIKIPIRSTMAICDALERLQRDKDFLHMLSCGALKRSKDFSPGLFAQRLLALLETFN